MSMREYGVNDYGLLLSDETMRRLASRLCDEYSEEEFFLLTSMRFMKKYARV